MVTSGAPERWWRAGWAQAVGIVAVGLLVLLLVRSYVGGSEGRPDVASSSTVAVASVVADKPVVALTPRAKILRELRARDGWVFDYLTGPGVTLNGGDVRVVQGQRRLVGVTAEVWLSVPYDDVGVTTGRLACRAAVRAVQFARVPGVSWVWVYSSNEDGSQQVLAATVRAGRPGCR